MTVVSLDCQKNNQGVFVVYPKRANRVQDMFVVYPKRANRVHDMFVVYPKKNHNDSKEMINNDTS